GPRLAPRSRPGAQRGRARQRQELATAADPRQRADRAGAGARGRRRADHSQPLVAPARARLCHGPALHCARAARRVALSRGGAAAPPAAVVDERFVRRYFAGTDPVGVRLNFGSVDKPEWREIVGVAGDVTNQPPPAVEDPMVYLPFAQSDWPYLGVVVRADGD